MMSLYLEVHHLSYTHQGNQHFTLHNINISLEQGNILAIVGESGSGKTTLLQLIAGLLDAKEGEILLKNEKVKGPSQQLVAGHQDIKVIFQHFNLSPKINVYQNIAYQLRAYTLEYRKKRTREMLRLCKLEGKEAHMPYQLSGGEKQRLAIARALAEEPRLLLLDEPFSNIDTMLKARLKQVLVDMIKESKTTAIVVSHDMGDALSVADQIAILQHGKLIQQDEPERIYAQPATPYVAQLFGRCNFLNAQQCQSMFGMDIPENHTVGIRAEHIAVSYQKGEKACEGHIIRQQFFGAYNELFIEVNEALLVANVSHSFKQGNTVYVTVERKHLMLFVKSDNE